MGPHFILGLDVGNSSLKAVLIEKGKGGVPRLRGVFRRQSAGLRRGAVMDFADLSQAIASLLMEVKKVSRKAVKNVYLGMSTEKIKAQHSQGVTAISRVDSEICENDRERVLRATEAIRLAANWKIVYTALREYMVDGVGDIFNPIGLKGNRLEASALVISIFAPHLEEVRKAVEMGGGMISDFVPVPIANSFSVLSKNQKNLGVAVIDIGAETTGVAAYNEGKLLGMATLPFGAKNITKDIAVGLKIPMEAAEMLKKKYGYASAREVGAKETIELREFLGDEKAKISRRFFVEIISARLAEILQFVHDELASWGTIKELAGGAILIGGGAKLAGLSDLVRQELKLTSQIGCCVLRDWESAERYEEYLDDPEFAAAFGIAAWGAEEEQWQERLSSLSRGRRGIRGAVKKIISLFSP
ncbi:cell division protein FtsA [Candidatus Parcubacteria bacterium]|nr:MAG: cell division protein FtsA [Candidatus Parcubacteria bacterium]